jgi:hypothetical protein
VKLPIGDSPRPADDLWAPEISVEELELATPAALTDAFPKFAWNVDELWRVNRPARNHPVTDFDWLMSLPLWRWRGQRFVLAPAQVLADRNTYRAHVDKAWAADLSYPVHVTFHNERWVILDGYHRLLKAHLLGVRTIPAVEVTPADLAKENIP